jgi:ribonuclease J
MLFRPSMIRDVEQADCLAGALLVYSMWPGYLKDQSAKRLLDWLAAQAISLEVCHTSGHASPHDLIRLCDACAPRAVVPIHTDRADLFADHFRQAMTLDDGVWFDIDKLEER